MVTALFIIVVLAALGTALGTLSQRQHLGSALDLDSARAIQAARAGLEWGAFQVLRNPAPPAAAPACPATTTFTLASTSLSSFTITVTCTRTPGASTVSDGDTALAFYTLVVSACNAPTAGSCPNTGTLQPTYVERQITWTVSR